MNEEKIITKSQVIREIFSMFIAIVAVGIIIDKFLKLSTILPYKVVGMVFCVVSMTILGVMVKYISKITFKDIGFLVKPVVNKCLFGCALGIGETLFLIGVFVALGATSEDILRGDVSIQSAILQTIYYFIFVAVSEEVIFRGYIFHRLNEAFNNKVLVIVLTSTLFMAFHYRTLNPEQAIETFLVSVIYCVVLYKSKDKSIVPLIIAHGLSDSLPNWLSILFS